MKKSLKDVLKGVQLQHAWRPRPELLLHPCIPQPLHGCAPRVVLGGPWWNKVRQEAYRSTDFHCAACGVPKHLAQFVQHLEAHEVYEIDYLMGLSVFVEVVPLCNCCHSYIHGGRLSWLLETGKITHARYASVIQHGERVLRVAKLPLRKVYNGPCADWSSWRLVIDGKEYRPLYKNQQEWEAAHKEPDEDA